MVKRLIPNYDFIENMSNEQFEEFINTPDGLPNNLMSMVREVIPEVNFIRFEATIDHPEFLEMDQKERAITHKMRRNNCTIDDEFNFSAQ